MFDNIAQECQTKPNLRDAEIACTLNMFLDVEYRRIYTDKNHAFGRIAMRNICVVGSAALEDTSQGGSQPRRRFNVRRGRNFPSRRERNKLHTLCTDGKRKRG